MIKLKNIINEESDFANYEDSDGRHTEISKNAVLNLLKKYQINLKELYTNGAVWRGDSLTGESDYYIVETQNFTRVSANTENYYTLLIDNLPEWSKFPKRSKSLICSTDKNLAEPFGKGQEPFLIIPLDKNSKMGVCSKEDIFVSFKMFEDSSDGIMDFTFFITSLAQHYEVDISTYEDLLQLLAKIEKDKPEVMKLLKGKDIPYFHNFEMVEMWEKSNASLLEVIRKALNPEINNFKLINYYRDHKILKQLNDNEVWTDAKSIMIKASEVENVIGSII